MTKWHYLVEGTDEQLRRLERAAKTSGTFGAIKRYIKGVQRALGDKEAVLRLIDEFHILPNVSVTFAFTPENDLDIDGYAGDPPNPQWVREQLARGNMYAWCQGQVRVRWLGEIGDAYLGAIMCSSLKDAMDLVIDHGLVEEAANDLLRTTRPDAADHASRNIHRASEWGMFLREFLHGEEHQDWVRY